jgi:hypothetical protein
MSNITKPNDRSHTIANAIRAALEPMTSADALRDEANEALNGAKLEAVNARELVMGKLAELAGQGAWTTQEIDVAAVVMAKQSNAELPKSIATFVGEAKRAMHPDVRDEFANILEVRNEAWDAEELARSIDKKAPSPIKKAFARKYHVLITLLGEAAKGHWLTTVDEVTAFAQARDPDVDADKALKALTKLREQLATIAANFPDADVVSAADMLTKIVTAKQLQEARDELLGVSQTQSVTKPSKFTKAAAAPNATKPARVAGSVPVVTATTEVASDDDSGVAEGASSVLDGILTNFEMELSHAKAA